MMGRALVDVKGDNAGRYWIGTWMRLLNFNILNIINFIILNSKINLLKEDHFKVASIIAMTFVSWFVLTLNRAA